MITPVNNHLVIEPLKHEEFIPTDHGTYQEIGVVVDNGGMVGLDYPKKGDKVFFDAWLAAKYPKGTEGEYYWLVKWEDVRAVEYVEP